MSNEAIVCISCGNLISVDNRRLRGQVFDGTAWEIKKRLSMVYGSEEWFNLGICDICTQDRVIEVDSSQNVDSDEKYKWISSKIKR